MANNRMWLVCTRCDDEVCIAKYYPSTGWYTQTSQPVDLEAWFARHRHGTLFGEEIGMYLSSDVPDSGHTLIAKLAQLLGKKAAST